jgi:transcriptional regulator with XRE-family HTH domain
MSEQNIFGTALKRLRAKADLSLKELAAQAGLTPDAIVKLEAGTRKPAWETVLALALALGVDCRAFQAIPEGPEVIRPRGRPPQAVPGATLDSGSASKTTPSTTERRKPTRGHRGKRKG